MGKAIGPTLFAAAAAVTGFFLRRWELATVYDETGLPISLTKVPASISLIGASLLVAVILAFLCRGRNRRFKGGYREAFEARNPVYMGGIIISALCLAGSALFACAEFLQAMQQYETPSFLTLLLAVLSVVSAGSILLTGLRNYKGESEKRFSVALLMPAYTCCLWLVDAYRRRSSDPLVIDYVYAILTIACILLALYFISGFSFDRPKVFRTSFFSLMTVYFCGVTLADGHDRSTMLLYLGFGLYLLISAAVLLKNNVRPIKGQNVREMPEEDSENNILEQFDWEVPKDEKG